jgi:hypothetical protein
MSDQVLITLITTFGGAAVALLMKFVSKSNKIADLQKKAVEDNTEIIKDQNKYQRTMALLRTAEDHVYRQYDKESKKLIIQHAKHDIDVEKKGSNDLASLETQYKTANKRRKEYDDKVEKINDAIKYLATNGDIPDEMLQEAIS